MNPNRRVFRGLTRTANSLLTRYVLRAWANVANGTGENAPSSKLRTRSSNFGSIGPAHRTHRVSLKPK